MSLEQQINMKEKQMQASKEEIKKIKEVIEEVSFLVWVFFSCVEFKFTLWWLWGVWIESIESQPTCWRNIIPLLFCFARLPPVSTLVSFFFFLAHSSTLKMEASCPSLPETSVGFQHTTSTWHCTPEDITVKFFPLIIICNFCDVTYILDSQVKY